MAIMFEHSWLEAQNSQDCLHADESPLFEDKLGQTTVMDPENSLSYYATLCVILREYITLLVYGLVTYLKLCVIRCFDLWVHSLVEA